MWKSHETNKRDKRQNNSEEEWGGHNTSTAHQLQAGRGTLPLSSSQMDHPENLGAIRNENKQMHGKKGGGKTGRRARRDSLHHLHASVSRMRWSYMEEECRWKSLQWECNKVKGYENMECINELQPGHEIYRKSGKCVNKRRNPSSSWRQRHAHINRSNADRLSLTVNSNSTHPATQGCTRHKTDSSSSLSVSNRH